MSLVEYFHTGCSGIVGSKLRIEVILEFWSEKQLKCILFTKWNSAFSKWIDCLFRLVRIFYKNYFIGKLKVVNNFVSVMCTLY